MKGICKNYFFSKGIFSNGIFFLNDICERYLFPKKIFFNLNNENIMFIKFTVVFFRTGLDTKYILLNDDKTGLLTYVGIFQ